MGHENEPAAPGSEPTADSRLTDKHHAWVTAFTGIDTRARAHRPHHGAAARAPVPPPPESAAPPDDLGLGPGTSIANASRGTEAAADRIDRYRAEGSAPPAATGSMAPPSAAPAPTENTPPPQAAPDTEGSSEGTDGMSGTAIADRTRASAAAAERIERSRSN